MNWPKLVTDLESRFAIEKVVLVGPRIHLPAEPVDLESALMAVTETEEEHEDSEGIGAEEILREQWPLQPFFTLSWGRDDWVIALTLLDVGTRSAYVVLTEEYEPTRVIAAVEPKRSREAFSIFARGFFATNGLTYDCEMLGSLPSRTTNWRPDLVAADVVKEAYWAWMEGTTPSEWADLLDELRRYGTGDLLDVLKELREALGASRTLVRPERQSVGVRGREASGPALSEAQRRRILDAYFAGAYR